MPEFLQQLEAGLARSGMRETRVLLAVSGGPDSVAMLRGMHALAEAFRLVLLAAHMNHQLRGESSDADAEWLQSLCGLLSVPLIVEHHDVAATARERGLGVEETARAVRYEFLERTARAHGCTHVAVAHTADDQAETILHHIVRGTGFEGLQGMRASRELKIEPDDDKRAQNEVPVESRSLLLARPMLDISRAAVESYLDEIGQTARADVSNLDERFTRNRIRLSLLPVLQRDYNPQVRDALRKLGQQAGELQELVRSLARDVLDRVTEDKNSSIARLNCDRMATAPRHLVREVFSLLWKDLGWPRQKMGFAEWDRLAALVVADGTARLPGGIEATRRGSLLVLRKV